MEEVVFNGCTSIQDVVFSRSITSLSGGEFNGCTSLNKVYYLGTEAEWNNISGFNMGNDRKC